MRTYAAIRTPFSALESIIASCCRGHFRTFSALQEINLEVTIPSTLPVAANIPPPSCSRARVFGNGTARNRVRASVTWGCACGQQDGGRPDLIRGAGGKRGVGQVARRSREVDPAARSLRRHGGDERAVLDRDRRRVHSTAGALRDKGTVATTLLQTRTDPTACQLRANSVPRASKQATLGRNESVHARRGGRASCAVVLEKIVFTTARLATPNTAPPPLPAVVLVKAELLMATFDATNTAPPESAADAPLTVTASSATLFAAKTAPPLCWLAQPEKAPCWSVR